MRRIGSAVGQYVASPVVESMDINAILETVDWNEVVSKVDADRLLERIDVNRLLERIDVNRLLDRVDANRHLDRVDVNRHLDRVDWDALLQRSNLEDIIARSTSGVLSGFANLMRTRMAWIDQWGQRLGRCGCCCLRRGAEYLPPRPGREEEDSSTVWESPGTLDQRTFARAIQFRTSGATNRLLYQMLDQLVLWTTFAMIVTIAGKLGEVFTNDRDWPQRYQILQEFWFEYLLYHVYSLLYWIFLVGCFGRSFGMWILGLLMVNKSGNRVSFTQVCLQGLLAPLNIVLFGWLIGFCRRDGAFVSDVIGGVAIVYSWDVRHLPEHNAEIALSLTDYVETLKTSERESLIGDSERAAASGREHDGRRNKKRKRWHHGRTKTNAVNRNTSEDGGGGIEVPDLEKGTIINNNNNNNNNKSRNNNSGF